jgi:hypothetical protein
MTIDELIKKLEHIRYRENNLDVVFVDADGKLKNVELVRAVRANKIDKWGNKLPTPLKVVLT